MWADVLTKPLQGAKFRLMRAFLMNCQIDYHEDPPPLPIFTPSVHPTSAPTTSLTTKRHLPSYEPTDVPKSVPMKPRSLRPNASLRGDVETHTNPNGSSSHGTHVPNSNCTTPQPTDKNMSW